MNFSMSSFCVSLGVVVGLSMFMFAMFSMFFGVGAAFVTLFSSLYVGYAATFVGSVVGFAYGFVHGYVMGFVFVYVNRFVDGC